jgi:hypothetical protein
LLNWPRIAGAGFFKRNQFSLIHVNAFLVGLTNLAIMKSSDQERTPDKEASEFKPSRPEEIRRLIEQYANDLREIIKRLRWPLN